MELHYFPQDYITSGRGAKTKLSKSQQINAINLGTCGLKDIKRSLPKPSEVGLKFDT